MNQLSIGEVQDVIQQLEGYLQDFKARWDLQKPKIQSWLSLPHSYVLQIFNFIVSAADELILFLATTNLANTDKKSAVMAVLNNLYDYVAAQALPIWLRPFNGSIKKILINVLISNLIDFMVEKYKSGFWSANQKDGQAN